MPTVHKRCKQQKWYPQCDALFTCSAPFDLSILKIIGALILNNSAPSAHDCMRLKRDASHIGIHNKFTLICALLVLITALVYNSHKFEFAKKKGIKIIKNIFKKKPQVKTYRKSKKEKEELTDKYEKLIMTYKSINKLVTANKKREGGGFMVRRPVGDVIDSLDPFLLLDHIGPVDYGPGEAIGAPDHPHRGFETVTYIIEGGIEHKDSVGNTGNLRAGWVQWMTAGSGVIHSEMPTEELLKNGGRMEGFQLWVNLPKKFKMVSPRYQDTSPEKIPVVKSPDGNTTVKVIAGTCLGTQAKIETRIPIMFLDLKLEKGATFDVEIPENFNSFIYAWRGNGFFGEKPVTMGQVASLSEEGDALQLKASEDEPLHVLVIGGQPIIEPIARYGPFVMNTYDEIQQAFSDYRSGKLGSIAGTEERFWKTDSAVNQNKKNGNWNKH